MTDVDGEHGAPETGAMPRPLVLLASVFVFLAPLAAAQRASKNAVLVLVDGLRWQEVFRGADHALIEHEKGGVKDREALAREFWHADVAIRRAQLMPFLWGTVAREGQILGDRDAGSHADVANGLNFSYPGYSEMLVGFHDARIDSNAKKPNPNVTVLEFLHGRPGYEGRVAAFGVWDVVPSIVNRERCGFYVNGGFEPVLVLPVSPNQALLNRLKVELPKQWSSMPPDAIAFHAMLEYVKSQAPRVLYFTFGETDEFAHAGRYDQYLEAARRTDAFLAELWTTLQSLPSHRGATTMIVAADHGRGRGPDDWANHDKDTAGAEEIWIAAIGPDTPPLGARRDTARVVQAQIAATFAACLGEDWRAREPRAASVIRELLR